MRTTIRIAALVLGGLAIVGCDDKDKTTVTTPDGTSTTVTTPNTSTMTDKAKDAANNAGNAISNGADKVKDAASNAADKTKAEAQKLSDKMSATTMPSMPSMGK